MSGDRRRSYIPRPEFNFLFVFLKKTKRIWVSAFVPIMNGRLVVLVAAVAAAAAAAFLSLDSRRDARALEIGRERDVELVALDGGAVGPESAAFGADGAGPYTGVSDGRVLKWLPPERRWVEHSSAVASQQ
ncbi:hypothetical protein GUJ93_ZPchr0012g21947 [Zizania palustris]|uniref:Uncharacterized protein n=1 Tax=Zizania palustris TaxID=103762 RepID=A0A8J5WRB5_ZIZPA|nr:hypothetical protein GUJ93_ZPchr0012g21947 [Zizania palustris]